MDLGVGMGGKAGHMPALEILGTFVQVLNYECLVGAKQILLHNRLLQLATCCIIFSTSNLCLGFFGFPLDSRNGAQSNNYADARLCNAFYSLRIGLIYCVYSGAFVYAYSII